MLDIDHGPTVFAVIIALVVTLPALYGLLFVDSYWKQHRDNAAEGGDDVFN